MSVTLRQPLTREECQIVRLWRNDPAVLPMLRTGHKSVAEQDAFYRTFVREPDADHWYYAIELDGAFIGMGGLTYLSRQPGQAEISLILAPWSRSQGLGSEAVDALLVEAKNRGLASVIGECYALGNLPFWTKQIVKRPARMTWEWTL